MKIIISGLILFVSIVLIFNTMDNNEFKEKKRYEKILEEEKKYETILEEYRRRIDILDKIHKSCMEYNTRYYYFKEKYGSEDLYTLMHKKLKEECFILKEHRIKSLDAISEEIIVIESKIKKLQLVRKKIKKN